MNPCKLCGKESPETIHLDMLGYRGYTDATFLYGRRVYPSIGRNLCRECIVMFMFTGFLLDATNNASEHEYLASFITRRQSVILRSNKL